MEPDVFPTSGTFNTSVRMCQVEFVRRRVPFFFSSFVQQLPLWPLLYLYRAFNRCRSEFGNCFNRRFLNFDSRLAPSLARIASRTELSKEIQVSQWLTESSVTNRSVIDLMKYLKIRKFLLFSMRRPNWPSKCKNLIPCFHLILMALIREWEVNDCFCKLTFWFG